MVFFNNQAFIRSDLTGKRKNKNQLITRFLNLQFISTAKKQIQ